MGESSFIERSDARSLDGWTASALSSLPYPLPHSCFVNFWCGRVRLSRLAALQQTDFWLQWRTVFSLTVA